MTDLTETSDPTPGDPTPGDPPATEPDPATRVVAAVEKEYRTLDDFTPDQLKVINEHTKSERSSAVNGYIEKQRASGDGATLQDIEHALEKRDAEHTAKDTARAIMEQDLFDNHGISVGSENYRKFSKASASFKVESLRTPEGIALIVKAAGIVTEKASNEAAQNGLDALYKPRAFDGTDLTGSIPPGGVSLKDLEAKRE